MPIDPSKLSPTEQAALSWILKTSCNLVSQIPDKTGKDVFGEPIAGMAVYRKLAKRGFCFETEEEPCYFGNDPSEEPFFFTPSMEITDEGRAALAQSVPYSVGCVPDL